MNNRPATLILQLATVLLCTLVLSGVSRAQEEETPLSEPKNYIKISPLALLEGYNQAIEMHYERRLWQRHGLQVGFGYLMRSVGIGKEPIWNRYRTRMEYRYYGKRIGSSQLSVFRPYMALEGFHLVRKMETDDPILTLTGVNATGPMDTIQVNRQVAGLNWKGGLQFTDKHFQLEVYFGIGVKFRNVRHTGRYRVGYNYEPVEFADAFRITYEDRKNIVLNIPIGLRFGYAF